MKRIIAFLILCVAINVTARSRQETFLQANKLYKDGNANEALALYDSLSRKGRTIWYNMGNCQYKKGDYAQALVCWQRAKRGALWKESQDIEHNEQIVLKKLGKKMSDRIFDRVYAQTVRATEYMSLLSLQIMILCVWYVLFLIGGKIPSGAKCIMFRSVGGGLVILLMCALYAKTTFHTPRGIIMQETPLFIGPDTRYKRVSALAHADDVMVCDVKDKWCKIKTKDTTGWVPVDALEMI